MLQEQLGVPVQTCRDGDNEAGHHLYYAGIYLLSAQAPVVPVQSSCVGLFRLFTVILQCQSTPKLVRRSRNPDTDCCDDAVLWDGAFIHLGLQNPIAGPVSTSFVIARLCWRAAEAEVDWMCCLQ